MAAPTIVSVIAIGDTLSSLRLRVEFDQPVNNVEASEASFTLSAGTLGYVSGDGTGVVLFSISDLRSGGEVTLDYNDQTGTVANDEDEALESPSSPIEVDNRATVTGAATTSIFAALSQDIVIGDVEQWHLIESQQLAAGTWQLSVQASVQVYEGARVVMQLIDAETGDVLSTAYAEGVSDQPVTLHASRVLVIESSDEAQVRLQVKVLGSRADGRILSASNSSFLSACTLSVELIP